MTVTELVRREIRRALMQAGNVVRRGVLGAGLSSDNTAKIQGAGDDDHEGVESWQHYGFRSRPPTGAEVAMLCPGGRGEGAIAIAEHDRDHVPTCAAGETVTYGSSDATTQAELRLKAAGDVELNGDDIAVDAAGDLDLDADSAAGSITATANAIDLIPTTVVDVGGSSTDFMLKGTSFLGVLATYLGSVATAKTTWDGSSKDLAAVGAWIDSINSASATLSGNIGGTIATKGKVT